MAFSSVGKTRLIIHLILFFVNLIVLALAARVNEFQEYFFVADLSPLLLSIVMLIFLTYSLVVDFCLENPVMGRAPAEIVIFTLFSILWLAFNSFSTSRWRYVPLPCTSIPNAYPDEIAWCKDLQALKSFIWIEWLILFFKAATTIRFVHAQHNLGNNHIWTTSLAHYTPHFDPRSSSFGRDHQMFMPFEKFT